MADETSKRRKRVKGSSGRATPKSTPSPRYTPPIPQSYKSSSRWIPIFMFGFFGIGVALILLNYLPGAPILPGDTNNWYLIGGLVSICFGFGFATQYR